MKQTDIFIVGGGINGTAIAADAAGRGLSVALCEQGDLASGTSSASTKLIHGGLRYLEYYEFGLVHRALKEREILLQRAPYLISPLEFVLPYESHLRPAWMIRCGLFLYDHLAKRKIIPASSAINFSHDPRGAALQAEIQKGFSYYDCMTDDARLTITNALSAKQHGAMILPHYEFISAVRKNNLWHIEIKNLVTQEIISCQATILINAAGPWINRIQEKINRPSFPIKLVQGSHIVVPKIYDGDFAYILQNKDGRIIFTIPYQKDFTLVGTTDVSVQENFSHAVITEKEIHYLCHSVNHYFKKKISPEKIIWSYSGVRCLQAEKKKKLSRISREHKIVLDTNDALMTIIGGKITTHRELAEEAVNKLRTRFPDMNSAWTAKAALPGGEMKSFKQFYQTFSRDFSWLPQPVALHYAKNYGTRAYAVLKDCNQLSDLGLQFNPLLYQREVDYLIEHEWAKTADDILWRRTKTGLWSSADDQSKLAQYIATSRMDPADKPRDDGSNK